MPDFDVIAYAMVGLSLSASAVQIGRWILNANPRALINAGRWSMASFIVAAPLVLLWLVMSGRSTLAMMFAAFVVPVFVQSGLRWRSLFPQLNLTRARLRGWVPNFQEEPTGGRSVVPYPMDAELVRQSVAVLKAYLDHVGSRAERQLTEVHLPSRPANGFGNGAGRRQQMSREEAFEVLGLEPTASLREIREACSRLEQKLDPEVGGTHYLASKINEAKDVLFEDWGRH
jgi:hypothetical protein